MTCPYCRRFFTPAAMVNHLEARLDRDLPDCLQIDGTMEVVG